MSSDDGAPVSGATAGNHDDHIHGNAVDPDPASRSTGSAHPATAVTGTPGGPAKPARLGLAGWRAIVKGTRQSFTEDRCSISAWSLACKGFLAIFPAVIALLGLVHLLNLNSAGVKRLTATINKILPPGASGVVTQAVSSASHQSARDSVAALIVGLLVAVWSVAGGISALQIALDIAYEVPHDRRFLARRLRSLPLMLATLTLGVIASVLSVFGASAGHAIKSHAPFNGTLFTIVWTAGRWLVALAAITLLLQIFYIYGPNRKRPRWRWASLGSAVGAAIFVLASLGFSFYVKNFGSYDKTYGALAGVVILILWLYLGGLAVLIGAELNAQRAAAATTSRPQP